MKMSVNVSPKLDIVQPTPIESLLFVMNLEGLLAIKRQFCLGWFEARIRIQVGTPARLV